MKRVTWIVSALALVFCTVGQAKADFTAVFVYIGPQGDSASGTLSGTGPVDAAGGYHATSGSITFTAINGAPVMQTYSLLPGGPGVTSSPSGAFIVDNLVYPANNAGSGMNNGMDGFPPISNPSYLDTYGLLFGKGNVEINIWGNGGPSNYQFDEAVNGGVTISHTGGTFILYSFVSTVPEPSGIALLGLGVVCLTVGYVVRRRTLAIA